MRFVHRVAGLTIRARVRSLNMRELGKVSWGGLGIQSGCLLDVFSLPPPDKLWKMDGWRNLLESPEGGLVHMSLLSVGVEAQLRFPWFSVPSLPVCRLQDFIGNSEKESELKLHWEKKLIKIYFLLMIINHKQTSESLLKLKSSCFFLFHMITNWKSLTWLQEG